MVIPLKQCQLTVMDLMVYHVTVMYVLGTIVGDNLDKNVKPRYRRIDRKTQSLHFFQYYAVRDRINLAGVSDSPKSNVPANKLPVETLLPTSADHQALIRNFAVLASRTIVEELPYFNKTFEGTVTRHINHIHVDEMAKKSETVS